MNMNATNTTATTIASVVVVFVVAGGGELKPTIVLWKVWVTLRCQQTVVVDV